MTFPVREDLFWAMLNKGEKKRNAKRKNAPVVTLLLFLGVIFLLVKGCAQN